MDPVELVKTRCKEAGLEVTSRRDPRATVREVPASEAKTRSNETLASPTSAPERDLPKISVELRGTLGGPVDPPSGPAAQRDLEVLETLGEGGMGRVFAARQHSLRRDVAIKTVRDQATDAQRAALLTEGAIMGSLEHPSIIPVHALGVDEARRPVLVMKRVEHAIEWTDLLDDPGHVAWEGRGGSADDRLEG
ncbi:MAG TPA: protein kinase, partial [Byssovorax sp.]